MSSRDFAAFDQFVQQKRKNLQRIAWKTRGEHQLADVVNEAYVLAGDLAARKDIRIDFLDPAFQDYLLACLYNHLVAFTEKKIRNGVRMDHAPDDDESARPLLDKLAVDETFEPESILLRAETESYVDNKLAAHPSLAAAYLRLLDHFNYRMQSVADHLLISVSHAYRCCANARRQETLQEHFCWPVQEKPSLPRPWRRFKIHRPL
jgi:hypothetical protein